MIAGIDAVLPLLTSVGAPVSGVPRVIDGDTIIIAGTTLRLAGIDAPELGQTCRGPDRSFDCGRYVAGALRSHIAGRSVQCATFGGDRYGRTLGRCVLDGTDLGEWLVSHGFARGYLDHDWRYVLPEWRAWWSGRGLWQTEWIAPSRFRQESRP